MKIDSSYSNNYISTISSPKNEKIEKMEKSKVETIKEAIQNNNYKIEINKTASKMAKELL